MKKIGVVLLLFIFAVTVSQAKKVKFSVNMSGQTISPNGIHISGDFQTLAGYPGGDWNSATTELTRETTDTNLYSVTVDIPAHRKYEFKFVNGNLFYEVEFVPEAARVGHDFVDNRWFYLDSLQNDTTLIGPIVYGGYAPAGKRYIRFKVDLKNESSIHTTGVFIEGSFNNFQLQSGRMYAFTPTVFEYQAYVDTASGFVLRYRFSNGNDTSKLETVPGTCSDSTGYRTLTPSADMALDSVCFAKCIQCTPSSGLFSDSDVTHPGVSVYPNPATKTLYITAPENAQHITFFDISGKKIMESDIPNKALVELDRTLLLPGLYWIRIDSGERSVVQKLILE